MAYVADSVAGLLFAGARRWRRRRGFLQMWGTAIRSSAGLEGDIRTLARSPWSAQGTRSSKRVNSLLDIVDGVRYLEIGVEYGRTFEAVRCRSRTGVDPLPRFRTDVLPSGVTVHAVPSDEYFAATPREGTLSGAFVDGLHEFRQTYRDIFAVIQRLEPGGFVLVDDVMPLDAISGIPDEAEFHRAALQAGRSSGAWMGDVWRAILAISRFHAAELDWRTITAENGRMQTLVWTTSDGELSPVEESELALISAESFESVMASGVPDSFHPSGWDRTLDAFRRGRMRS